MLGCLEQARQAAFLAAWMCTEPQTTHCANACGLLLRMRCVASACSMHMTPCASSALHARDWFVWLQGCCAVVASGMVHGWHDTAACGACGACLLAWCGHAWPCVACAACPRMRTAPGSRHLLASLADGRCDAEQNARAPVKNRSALKCGRCTRAFSFARVMPHASLRLLAYLPANSQHERLCRDGVNAWEQAAVMWRSSADSSNLCPKVGNATHFEQQHTHGHLLACPTQVVKRSEKSHHCPHLHLDVRGMASFLFLDQKPFHSGMIQVSVSCS